MNERIKELIKQATECYSNGQERTFDKEKFAELIVKETMQVVANQLPSNQYLDVAHAVIEHYKDDDVT
jgi:hypothetical protein